MCHFDSQRGSSVIKILIDQYIQMIKNTKLISTNWNSGPRTTFDLLSEFWEINKNSFLLTYVKTEIEIRLSLPTQLLKCKR